ncbi:MAG: hypothetical protein ACFFA7_05620 [Promethearchaeota archaeon]
MTKEFKINQYLTIKLENDKTVIYISGERFRQCKYLLLINPQENENSLEIKSVDQASENLTSVLEREIKPIELGITPEQEFWGHCSNIQAWVENNYDTRLLHSNLAFPLLEELSKQGDLGAKRAFKEEIAKRLKDMYVLDFFREEGYLSYLNQEELFMALLKPEEVNAMIEISNLTHQKYAVNFDDHNRSKNIFYEDGGHVTKLEIDLNDLCPSLPKQLEKFAKLLTLKIRIYTNKEKYVKFDTYMEGLKALDIQVFNEVFLPDNLNMFPNLRVLKISGEFEDAHQKVVLLSNLKSMGNLKNLEELIITNVRFEEIPNNISEKLEWLIIRDTNLKTLPESILKNEKFKIIDLRGNKDLEILRIPPKMKKKIIL